MLHATPPCTMSRRRRRRGSAACSQLPNQANEIADTTMKKGRLGKLQFSASPPHVNTRASREARSICSSTESNGSSSRIRWILASRAFSRLSASEMRDESIPSLRPHQAVCLYRCSLPLRGVVSIKTASSQFER